MVKSDFVRYSSDGGWKSRGLAKCTVAQPGVGIWMVGGKGGGVGSRDAQPEPTRRTPRMIHD